MKKIAWALGIIGTCAVLGPAIFRSLKQEYPKTSILAPNNEPKIRTESETIGSQKTEPPVPEKMDFVKLLHRKAQPAPVRTPVSVGAAQVEDLNGFSSSEQSAAPSLWKKTTFESETALVRDFWIWGGAGVNLTSYTQTVPGFSDVTFGGIKAPSQMFRAGFFVSDHYALDLNYKNTPGEVNPGEGISVSAGSYVWQTLSAELIYRPAHFSKAKETEWLWRLGVQHHQMPFFVPLTANSLAVQETSTSAVSVGFEYRKKTRKQVRIELMGRYQYPISSAADVGSSFSLTPDLAFDGSIGAAYEVGKNVFLGAYWHGQYHSYKFDYDNSSGTSFAGEQKLFFSNFDLRLGVEF